MKKLLTLILIILIVLSGCGASNLGKNSTYYVTITVQALDSITGLAVADAVTIIENGPVGKNSGEGMTVFTNVLGNKDYTFVTSASSYNLNRKTVHIGSENTTITITLNKSLGTITGFTVDETEAPISAEVRLIELNKTTISNETTGEFIFTDVPVIDDSYSISITKAGFNERIISNIKLSTSNLTATVGKIVIGNTPGVLMGQVTDLYSKAVQYAEVRVLETNQSITTDYNGDYTLQVFPGSNYTVVYNHSDYGQVTKNNVVIRPNQSTVINVSLPIKPGSIFGIVRNGLDSPIPGATVTVVGTGLSAITSIDGSFRVSNVPPGTYTLSITHDLYNPTSASTTVKTNEETDIGIAVMPSLTGTVQGYISDSNCTVILATANQANTFTNPSNFQFQNIPAGQHILKIERTPYKSVFIPFVLGSGETYNHGTLNCRTYLVGAPFGAETQAVTVSTENTDVVISYPQTITFSWWNLNDLGTNINLLCNGTKIHEVFKNFSDPTSGSKTFSVLKGDVLKYKVEWLSANGSISCLNDIKIPQINISRTWGAGDSSYAISINAIDQNLTGIYYLFTQSQTMPSSGYIAISNGSSVTINSKGIWYLHVVAQDSSGKEGYRCEGPYIIK